MNKVAIVVLSDPKSGTDEALGRVFNALASAYDYKQANQDDKIVFQGAGTRWPKELQKADHPANELYKSLEANVEGISCGCADVFGADPAGLDLIKDSPVPGTSGVTSFAKLEQDGYRVLNF